MTRQRQIILRIIKTSQGHLTAEQIFIEAKRLLPSIAVATVYRNLNLMVDAGEIRRVSILNGPDYFDSNTAVHDHLICENCGKILDVTIDDLKPLIERKIGRPVLSYELNIHFLCPDCAEKSAGEGETGKNQ